MVRLLSMRNPNQAVRYYDVVGGFEDLIPVHGCNSGTIAGRVDSAGLTKQDVAQINATARRIRRDTSEVLDVRTAAACLGG
jgi:hypothetical protein